MSGNPGKITDVALALPVTQDIRSLRTCWSPMNSGFTNEKAGNDLKLAEIRIEHNAPTDTVAFHLQQTAEKTLKALLASRMIIYPKAHDLDELFDLLPDDFLEVLSFREKLIGWTSYAWPGILLYSRRAPNGGSNPRGKMSAKKGE